MTTKNDKPLVCPNCFGTVHREVLATPTSRNIVDDDSVPAGRESGMSEEKRKDVIKLFCNHCGHELHRRGNRA
jgi:predicted HNH restriction endonuclease